MEMINRYGNQLFSSSDEHFDAIFQSLSDKGIRNRSVSPATAQWLMLLVKAVKP